MAVMTFTDIPVSEIDLSDTGFRITAPRHGIEDLTASICQYGIMVAPLVLRKQHKYIVVSGFRRISAALKAGLSKIPCRLLSGPQNIDAAMAAVTENSFSRELTSAELIRSIALLLPFMDAETIAKHARAIFNMPLNAGYINTLVRIHAMPDSAVDLLENGQISIKACKRLGSMNEETIAGFLDIFSMIKVSSGIQMETIAWANEICALENISLSTLIKKSPLGERGHETGQGGQHHKDMGALGKQFKAFLGQRRFPVLTAAQNKAREQIKGLNLDSGLKLSVPENFEGIVYTMQVNFKNVDEFKQRLNHLAELSGHAYFQSLVDKKT